MLDKLEARRQQRGGCLPAPDEHQEGPALGTWVSTQRGSCEKLDSRQIARLEPIGYIWSPFVQWRGEALAKPEGCREERGGCLVPCSYKEDCSLGQWVSCQCHLGPKLGSMRRERLESIGLIWRVKGSRGSAP